MPAEERTPDDGDPPPPFWTALRLTLLAFAAVFGLADRQAHAQTAAQAPFVNTLLYLQQHNYTVTQGTASEFSFNDCMRYSADFGTCFGNNPLTPYIVLHPPVSPAPNGNTLPGYMMRDFGFNGPMGGPNGSSQPVANTFYQLDTNEAIVTVITLPPPAAYFSFQSYMFSRPTTDYGVTDPGPPPCMGRYPTGSTSTITMDCLSYQVFGYFDNALNNVVIQRASGLSFSSDGSQVIAVITTPNQTLATNLTNAFQANGITTQVFLERMAPSTHVLPADNKSLHIGLTPDYDIFVSILRYAVPVGGTAMGSPGYTWLANAANNVLVYRVQLPNPNTMTISTPVLNKQSCNTNETLHAGADGNCLTTSAKFDTDLQQIRDLLLASPNLAVAGYTYQSAQFDLNAGQLTMGSSPKGPICIQNGTTCVGATEDNNAYRGKNIGLLAGPAPAFVIGVIHSTSADVTSTTPVNNAAYTSIGAADGSDNAGVTQISQANIAQTGVPQDPQYYLNGSAASVLNALNILIPPAQYPQLNADLPNIYITIFARPNCKPQFCDSGNSFVDTVQSSTSQPTFIQLNHTVFLTERAYMLPSVGAAPSQPPMTSLTGADATYLESPYVVYACPSSGCPTSSSRRKRHSH